MLLGSIASAWGRVDDAAAKSGVVVLDDRDPNFKGPDPRGDAVTRFNADGTISWTHAIFNNCETYGGHHGVVIDSRRDRVYVRELVAKRVTAFDADGKQIYRIGDIKVSALAIDPQTGNLWATGDHGRTEVLDTDGKKVASYAIGGFDIDYDSAGSSFWITNHKEVYRVDLKGRSMLKQMPTPAYAFVSVAADPIGDGAWLVERSHPDVPESVDRVVFVNGEGEVKKQVGREKWIPFGIACDARARTAWVVSLSKSLTRIPFDGDEVQDFPITARAVAVGPVTGDVWVTTESELLRLDGAGKIVKQTPLAKPSNQSWIAAY